MSIRPLGLPEWLAPVEPAGLERQTLSRTIRVIFLAVIVAAISTSSRLESSLGRATLWCMIGALCAALVINHLGAAEWAAAIGFVAMLCFAAAMAWSARDGFRTIYFLLLACLLMIAALLFRPVLYSAFAVSVLAIIAAVGLKEMRFVAQGGQMPRTPTTNTVILAVECIFCIGGLTGGLLASNLHKSIRRVRVTARELAAANAALQASVEAQRGHVSALRESEERYRMLAHALQSAGECISITDTENRILFVNDEFLRTYGYKKDELIGQHISILRSEHNSQGVYDEILPATMAGGWSGELWNRTQGGRHFTISLATSAVHDEVGQRVALVGIARDITDRKRAEEEKANLQAQLHQAQKMESIGRLAGGVAHDFNNLLTVINGYSRMLLGNLNAGDPIRDYVEEICQAGERAAGLTQQLLAFSRKQVLKPRVLDLNRVVGEMRPMLARLLGEDVELRVELHAEASTICADQSQLEQVVMNLAVNSRHAMPHGGTLGIETASVEWGESQASAHPGSRAGHYVMLAVTDTGAGMNEATRRHIFEPFFTTKEVGQGTGLGLSMVQGIVEQSGGHIEVYSEPGQGTSFKIYLPKVEDTGVDARQPGAARLLPGHETVLVVEDQADVRTYAAAALAAHGYRVIQAGSGAEAVLFCARGEERIDLVLTDVVMPNMSGRELADRLEECRPGIKVLFMSGYTDDAIMHHRVLDKGTEFIQKPFSPDQLAAKVRDVLVAPGSPS